MWDGLFLPKWASGGVLVICDKRVVVNMEYRWSIPVACHFKNLEINLWAFVGI